MMRKKNYFYAINKSKFVWLFEQASGTKLEELDAKQKLIFLLSDYYIQIFISHFVT